MVPLSTSGSRTQQGERDKAFMAISYSLALRYTVPGEPKSDNKTYAVAQVSEKLDLPAIAKHMAGHDNKYNKGDIMAVVTQLSSCIKEQLLLGNKVDLGDLGSFAVTLASDGADNAEAFSTSMIKRVRVRWYPSKALNSLINEASFQFVGTRESQQEARKQDRERLNSLATIKPGMEAPDDAPENDEQGGLGD